MFRFVIHPCPLLCRSAGSAIGFFVLMVWEPSQGGVENKRFEWCVEVHLSLVGTPNDVVWDTRHTIAIKSTKFPTLSPQRLDRLPDDGVFRFEGTGVVVASMTEAVTAGGLDATVDVVARADALKRANRSNQYAQVRWFDRGVVHALRRGV